MVAEIAFHASHEQFAPSALLALAVRAEQAGFDCLHSSDHFHPWSERQGQSGHSWSWLGAALARTSLPCGLICAPGWRQHPAVVAQAAATIGEMFPGRFRLELGSGEAISEAITGEAWPDKAERNARLAECVAIIRALLAGETVTHRGRVSTIEARLYTRPGQAVPLFGAAVTVETARWIGSWADGMATVWAEPGTLSQVVDAFRSEAGRDKPVAVKVALSYAATEAEAEHMALEQWAPVIIGGDVNWELRHPRDFDRASRFVRGDDIRKAVLVSADLGRHRAWLAELDELGLDQIVLHNVGTNQAAFIDAFGEHVLPALRHRGAARLDQG